MTVAPSVKCDLVDVAGHARTDVDLIDRLETADELVQLDDLLDHRVGDRHLGRSLLRECTGRGDEQRQEPGDASHLPRFANSKSLPNP